MSTSENHATECVGGHLPADCDAEGITAAIDDGSPNAECTLYPTDADEADLVTTWLTARGDAFVSLGEMR